MAWPQDAYVGQKVVCVGSPLYPPRVGQPIPIIGEVYTITRLDISPKGILHFEVVEIKPILYSFVRWAWNMFEPVIERKTDISIFTAMLGPKETADV